MASDRTGNPMTTRLLTLLLTAVLLPLAGCGLLYASRLGDAERDCDKLAIQSAVQECRQKLSAQQTAFQRSQADKARPEAKPAKPGLCYTRQATGETVCPN
jgi:predicted small lipoprotein YifL